MKKMFVFLFVSLYSSSLIAFTTPVSKPLNANDMMVPIASGKVISLHDLAYIKVADYEIITGKKLSLLKKIEFKLSQRKLRKSMNEDGTFSNKQIEKMFESGMDGETGFHLGGFALGLTLIGVLIAYLINDEKKRNRVRWAWIGAALFIFLFLLFRL